MILCFEGPSAIGKTTLSQSLSQSHLIVPEVNLLFKREQDAGRFWYYEKQVERFQLCQEAKQDSILDGDPFQPLWYNWIYGYPAAFPSFEETKQFYQKEIAERRISFPDLYLIFTTDLEALKKRKQADKNRRRSNFEKHLQLIQPQRDYFDFIKNNTSIPVEFVAYESVEQAQKQVLDLMRSFEASDVDSSACFEEIVDWLEMSSE